MFSGLVFRLRIIDPLHPMQVRYQAAPCSETVDVSIFVVFNLPLKSALGKTLGKTNQANAAILSEKTAKSAQVNLMINHHLA
jgi:hypothetical protein